MHGIIAEVHKFYTEAGEAFPLPDPKSCLMYAVTEVGEAVDALLREERPGDKRRRTDKSDFRDELGDVVLMLSASLYDVDYQKYPIEDVEPTLPNLLFQIAAAWMKFGTGNWVSPVIRALAILQRYPDYDALTSVRSRILKIKRERLEKPEVKSERMETE